MRNFYIVAVLFLGTTVVRCAESEQSIMTCQGCALFVCDDDCEKNFCIFLANMVEYAAVCSKCALRKEEFSNEVCTVILDEYARQVQHADARVTALQAQLLALQAQLAADIVPAQADGEDLLRDELNFHGAPWSAFAWLFTQGAVEREDAPGEPVNVAWQEEWSTIPFGVNVCAIL